MDNSVNVAAQSRSSADRAGRWRDRWMPLVWALAALMCLSGGAWAQKASSSLYKLQSAGLSTVLSTGQSSGLYRLKGSAAPGLAKGVGTVALPGGGTSVGPADPASSLYKVLPGLLPQSVEVAVLEAVSVDVNLLNGKTVFNADEQVALLRVKLLGDGATTLSAISVLIDKLATGTAIPLSVFNEFRLYRSADATLDAGDTLIGSSTSTGLAYNTAFRVAATTPDIVPSTGQYYFVAVTIAADGTHMLSYRPGFPANGIETSFVPLGTAIAANDANKGTIDRRAAQVSVPSSTVDYNGQAHGLNVITNPSGIAVNVTYEGATAQPTGPGTFSVVATVTDIRYIGTGSGVLTINPPPPPVPALAVAPLQGNPPLAVNFTDASTGFITSWNLQTKDDQGKIFTDRTQAATGTYSTPGPHQAVLTVTGPGGTAQRSFTVTVNAAPTVGDIAVQPVPEDEVLTLDLSGVVSGEGTWAAGGLDDKLIASVAVEGNVLRFTPVKDAFGSDTVLLTRSNEFGLGTTREVVLTWIPVDDRPRLEPPLASVFEGTEDGPIAVSGTVVDIDTDLATLVWGAGDFSNDLVFNAAGGPTGVVFTPKPNAFGQTRATITVRDPATEAAVSQVVELRWAAVNDPPLAPTAVSPGNGAEGVSTAPVLSWTGVDPDGDVLVYDVFLGISGEALAQVASGIVGTSVGVTGLEEGLAYAWEVVARDPSGAEARARFGFATERDTRPPVLSGISVGVTQNSATLTWDSDEPATSEVSFGIGGTGNTASGDDSGQPLVQMHSVTLQGLEPATWYRYIVRSSDDQGNTATTALDSLLTLARPDTDPPEILVGPLPQGIGRTNLVVRVRADELVQLTLLLALEGEAPGSAGQAQSDGAAEEHVLPFDGLEPGTAYGVQAVLVDAAGNRTASTVAAFTTLEREDIEPPEVVARAVRGLTDTEALIEVEATEPVTVQLAFGQNEDLSDRRVVSGTVLQPLHALRMVGLLPETDYFASVELRDAAGNLTTVALRLATLAAPDTEPPVFVNGPIVDGLTDNSAILLFDLNEPSQVRTLLNLPGEDAPFVRESSEFRLSRRQELTRLAPDTEYSYEVQVRDRFGNTAMVSGTFRTESAPDLLPPVVEEGPLAEGVEANSATVVARLNELGTGTFFFGKTAAAEDGRVDLTDLSEELRVRLTGLEPATQYFVRLQAADAAGNAAAPVSGSFSTLAAADLAPPVVVTLLNFQGVTATAATAGLGADEPVEAVLRYSTAPELTAALVVFGSGRRRNHNLPLTGLKAATTYHVEVELRDAAGNLATLRGSFTTAQERDTTPPAFNLGPLANDLQATSGRVVWSLNEPAGAELRVGTAADLSGARVVRVLERKRDHAVQLRDLAGGTSYFLQVVASDAAGNVTTSPINEFRTPEEVRQVAPLITNGPVAQKLRTTDAEIFWRTDQAANARVEFFADDTPGDVLTASRAGRATDHALVLTNLRPGVTYTYTVRSANAQRLEAPPRTGTFTTENLPDTAPPAFVSPVFVADIKQTQARIGWGTDEPSNSQVVFSAPDGVERVVTDPGLVLQHSVVLNSLTPATRYTFRVLSTDREGNGPTTSETFDFVTDSAPDETAAQFTKRPIIKGRTETTLSIAFETNEPTTAVVVYGLTAAFEAGSVTRAELRTDHEILLTQLEPGQTYFIRIGIVDAASNGPTFFPGAGAVAAKATQDGDGEFTAATLEAADERAPEIIAGPIAVSTTVDGAVIEWQTDELADGRVFFEAVDDTAKGSTVDAEFRRDHRQVLSGLRPGTTYRYRVASSDVDRNGPTTSTEFTFTTEAVPDVQPPHITSGPVALDVTQTQATITWTTDEPASTVLDYGTDTNYGEHLEQGDLVQEHKLTLTDLTPGTEYHFKVASRDLSNNQVTTDPDGLELFSQDHSFSTLGGDDDQAPIFVETPVVEWTDDSAVISWQTDELSTSRIDWAGGDVQDFIEDNTLERDHSLALTGLAKRTSYFFRVSSVDAAGNEAVWGVEDLASLKILAAAETDSSLVAVAKALQPPGGAGRFVTRNAPDTRFPVITGGPRVRDKTATSLTLEWETDERADSFVRFGEEEPERVKGSAQDVLSHRVTLTNLEAGQEYAYIVESTDPSGNGAARSRVALVATASEVDLDPPRFTSAPRIASRTDRSAVVVWRLDEAASSRIEYWPATDERQVVIRRFNQREQAPQVTLTNLRPSTDYVVRVFVTDASQNEGQAPIDVALRTDGQPDVTPPRIVEGPEIVDLGNTSVTIEWETDELGDSFVDFDSKPYLGQVVGSPELGLEHRVVLTNLTPETRYFYRVGSRDAAGNGPTESRVAVFTTASGSDTEAPEAPDDLAATGGVGSVLLEWEDNDEADLAGYSVYREVGGRFRVIATNIEEGEYRDTGRPNGTLLRYRITATDRSGNESEPSDIVEATPGQGQGPGAPVVLGLQRGLTPQQPIVRVQNASGATLYTIQISTRPDFGTIVDRVGNLPAGSGGETRWRVTRRLNPNTAYWFRARGSDGRLQGPWSASVQLRPTQAAALVASDDIDGDGAVSFADFFALAHGLGGADPLLDLNLDGRVDGGDVVLFGKSFGQGGSLKPSRVAELAVVEPAQLVVTAQARDDGQVEVVLALDQVGPVTGFGVVLGYDPTALRFGSLVDTSGHPLQVPHLGIRLVRDDFERVLVAEHYQGRLQAGPLRQGELVRLRFELGGQRQYADLVVEEGYVSRGGGDVWRVGTLGRSRVLPQGMGLFANYPNPFNPATTIPFALPGGLARGGLSIYNALGQLVRVWDVSGYGGGYHALVWDGLDGSGRSVGSGLYIVRLWADGRVETRKIALVK